ncbi:uncharacterized protein LOC121728788 [Aricia agestis]|uniref:uncharacterized protein LOC121728788 n=1 Tax=Aricia agestis TaxID=91739 RepID=UPI001C205478|nr:uncharacterized protein LOC121728788 [Aricia agestis]
MEDKIETAMDKEQNVEKLTDKQNIVREEIEPVKKDLSKSTSLISQKEVIGVIDENQQETEGEAEKSNSFDAIEAQQEVVKEQNNVKDSVKVIERTELEGTTTDEVEEIKYVEDTAPDPAAPYNLTDSSEELKPPFKLKPDQLAELEELWNLYQDYTPAYTDISGYITEKELIYMLKSLFLMPYTSDQLQELIAYCVRPPHPEGHIEFDQFVKIATIRYRDISIEDNLRSALQVLDQGEGLMNRDHMREVLTTLGHKMPAKQLNLLIKEVDIRNDGLIGIEDVMATICIDLIFE